MNDSIMQYVDFVKFLGRTLPEAFEIILFDTTVKELPVIVRVNRMNGTQEISKELVRNILKNDDIIEKGSIENFPQTTSSYKIIKTSVSLIKNEDNSVVGALCINIKCDIFLQLQSLASSVLKFSPIEISDIKYDGNETDDEYEEPSLDMISKVVEEYGVEPNRVTQNERIEIICDLYDMGVFELKGAVAKTAEVLEISQQSIYRYLSQIKKARS